jgi:CheY-like chemotaxis protein
MSDTYHSNDITKKTAEHGGCPKACTNYALALLKNVDHELRTPLSAISGYLHLLENSDLSPGQQKFIDLIKTASEKIEKITSGISNFCEFCGGEILLCKAKFNISNIFIYLVNSFEENAREKGCVLLYGALPFHREFFYGDEYKLKQALSQLSATALFHAENGEVILAARETGHSGGETSVKFTISYTGPSPRIDAAKLLTDDSYFPESITDDYIFRLIYAKTIIKAMGGSIGCEFQDAVSVNLTVTLKLKPFSGSADSGKSGPAAERSTAVSQREELSRRSLEILLIEDNFIGRRLIKNIIENIGWKIDLACDAFEGLDYYANKKYDLILLDIQMPEMNGYEFTRKLRGEEKAGGVERTPIIAVTAYSLPSDRENCFAAGMDGYISKPISVDNFYSTISDVLKNLEK